MIHLHYLNRILNTYGKWQQMYIGLEYLTQQHFTSTKDSHFTGKNIFAFQDLEITYRNTYNHM